MINRQKLRRDVYPSISLLSLGILLSAASFSDDVYASASGLSSLLAVTNVSNNTVSVLEPGGTIDVIGTGGSTPDGVTFSSNGQYIYVSNFNSHTVAVIQTSTGSAAPGTPVNVQISPRFLRCSPDGTKVYVPNTSSNTVSVIRTSDQIVTSNIPVGALPFAVSFSPTEAKAYVTNFSSNSVSVIDTSTDSVSNTISTGIGTNPLGVDFTPEGDKAYVSDHAGSHMAVIDTATETASSVLLSGSSLTLYSVAASPNQSDHKVYIANNQNPGSVYVIDTQTDTVSSILTSTIGSGPIGVAFLSDASYSFVTNNASNTLSVFDHAGTAGSTISVTGPFGIAASPMYVTGTYSVASDSQMTSDGIGLDPARGNSINFAGGTLSATADFSTSKPVFLSDGIVTGITASAGGTIDTGSNSLTFSGVISGGSSGTLTKTGAGTLTLSAINTYPGDTHVNQGTLNVSGSIANSAVTVNNGGTLKGTGTVGNLTVNSGGIVAPGNSIGTLNVSGDYTLDGTYQAEIASDGTSDNIISTGTATLTSGILDVILVGPYHSSINSETFTIIEATVAVTGPFAQEKSSSLLSYDVSYNTTPTPKTVTISNVKRTYTTYLPPGTNPNIVASEQYMLYLEETTSASSDLGNIFTIINAYVASSDKASYVSAFNQIQPSLLSQDAVNTFQTLSLVGDTLSSQQDVIRLEDSVKSNPKLSAFMQLIGKTKQFSANIEDIVRNFASTNSSLETGAIQNIGVPEKQRIKFGKSSVWLQGFGQKAKMKNSSYTPGYDATTMGFSIGGDHEFANRTYLGAFAGFADNQFNWNLQRGKGSIKTYYAGLYGTKLFENKAYIDGQIMGGINKYGDHRYITLPVVRTAKSNHNGANVFAKLGLGKEFSFANDLKIQPFAKVAYGFIHEQGFTEEGAISLDLQVRRKNSHFIGGEVGASFYKTFEKDNFLIRPEFTLAYLLTAQVGGGRGRIESNLVDEPGTLIVQGDTQNLNQVAPSLSITAQNKNGFFVTGSVQGEIGERLKTLTAFATMGYNF